ncbi:MAG: hypothetical protein K5930_03000 [Treponemataceae bacterium]|nr:hypothetical protein [Treponemataceae bacterium]
MLLYILTIGGTVLLVFLGNIFIFPADMSILKVSLLSILLPVIVIAWDGIFATLIRHTMPASWFSKDLWIYKVSKIECKLYEKLGIKRWKDKVLELGMFTSFSKKTVADPKNPEYINRFILECNYGAAIHFWNFVLGFFLLMFFPHDISMRFILPGVITNSFLSILPLMILRYNVPRLTRIHTVLQNKAERSITAEV